MLRGPCPEVLKNPSPGCGYDGGRGNFPTCVDAGDPSAGGPHPGEEWRTAPPGRDGAEGAIDSPLLPLVGIAHGDRSLTHPFARAGHHLSALALPTTPAPLQHVHMFM